MKSSEYCSHMSENSELASSVKKGYIAASVSRFLQSPCLLAYQISLLFFFYDIVV